MPSRSTWCACLLYFVVAGSHDHRSAFAFRSLPRISRRSLTPLSFPLRTRPLRARSEDEEALGPFWGPLINGEDGEAYPPFGSLVRQGPVPFFIRLSDETKYEMAVLNYMAQERCGRREAQGNMDAFFADPNGWALDKIATKEGKVQGFDYAKANTNPQQLVLTSAWVGLLLSIAGLIFKIKVIDA